MRAERPHVGTNNPFELLPSVDVQDRFIRFIRGLDEDARVTLTSREAVMKDLAGDRIERHTLHAFLQRFPTPFEIPSDAGTRVIDEDRVEDIFAELVALASTERSLTLLVTSTRDGLHGGLTFTPEDVLTITERYPDPIAFVEWARSAWHLSSGSTFSKDIEHALPIFLKKIYGERARAWVQLNLLNNEARKQFGSPHRPEEARHSSAPPSLSSSSRSHLPPRTTDRLLQKIEVHGSEGTRVTPEMLRDLGLGPKHLIKIEDIHLWSSNAYEITDGRLAVVGYVQANDRLVARSFYLSNSHGVWKYLPSYLPVGPEAAWYDKGFGEQSILLPFEAQALFAEISDWERVPIPDDNGEEIFLGITRRIHEQVARGTYRVEVAERPKHLEGNFYPTRRTSKIAPENVNFYDLTQSPDFTRALSAWRQTSNLYGEVKNEVYPSHNAKLRYLLCRDDKDRAWVGGIEQQGHILSTGLRNEWIDGGDLTTSAYEYPQQTAGYGNAAIFKDNYIDLYTNYVSKIPTIQEYMKHKRP